LGAVYSLPHGRTVGLFLPYTIQYNTGHQGEQSRYRDLAVFLGLPATTPEQGAASLVQAIRQLATEIGQPLTIQRTMPISFSEFEKPGQAGNNAANDTQIITRSGHPMLRYPIIHLCLYQILTGNKSRQ
jgi:acetaldehyde dehydrogenase/alcohol dehydrogenase